MRYPENNMSLDSAMPTSSIQAWLGQELETRGIDAMIYTRYILSILQQDSFEFEHIEADLFPMKKDLLVKKEFPVNKGKSKVKKGDRRRSVDGEEMKKTAAVECLMSVSDMAEKDEGLKSLVEETYRKLKEHQRIVASEVEATSGASANPVPSSGSSGASASVTITPPVPCEGSVSPAEEDEDQKDLKSVHEGYYEAFPALSDECKLDPLPVPKEADSVWSKKNAKLSPAPLDADRSTPVDSTRSQPDTTLHFRRSQSRGSGGDLDENHKYNFNKSRRKSKEKNMGSPNAESKASPETIGCVEPDDACRSRNYCSLPRSQRYRSRSQEKFSSSRNKHTPRPYVFYKVNRDAKGFGKKDSYPAGRTRTRQPGSAFFTPRYQTSPIKLGKAPKYPESLKITDDILRLLHVRPEQEQRFDNLISGTFPRHPIRVGHRPRKSRDDDDVFLYTGPIETVFPPSETRQGRLYERHSCSSVDDLVMAADVTDTVTKETANGQDPLKASRFLPFILSQEPDDLGPVPIMSLTGIDIDPDILESSLSDDEDTPRADDRTPLSDLKAFAKELEEMNKTIQRSKYAKDDLDSEEKCEKTGERETSPCSSDGTLITSSESGSESTDEGEYDFSHFSDFIETKMKEKSNHDKLDDRDRAEKLASQIDGATSRGLSLLQHLKPDDADWLIDDGMSDSKQSENLAKENSPDAELRSESVQDTAHENEGIQVEEIQVRENQVEDQLERDESLGVSDPTVPDEIEEIESSEEISVEKADVSPSVVDNRSADESLDDVFEQLGIFGETGNTTQGDAKQTEGDFIEVVLSDVRRLNSETDGESVNNLETLNIEAPTESKISKNMRLFGECDPPVDTCSSGIESPTAAIVEDVLPPVKQRLGGFPALLPKKELEVEFELKGSREFSPDNEQVADMENQFRILAEDVEPQDLHAFGEEDDIMALLPQSEDSVETGWEDNGPNEVVTSQPLSCNTSETDIPSWFGAVVENDENRKAAEIEDLNDMIQIFTIPVESFSQEEQMLTKDDIVVRVVVNDSSSEETSSDSDSDSEHTTIGSDGYSEILGDLDNVLAGLNIDSDDMVEVAETSAQFLEDLKLLDELMENSASGEELSGSEVVGHHDAWTVSDGDTSAEPEQVEKAEGLQRSFSDHNAHGLLPLGFPNHRQITDVILNDHDKTVDSGISYNDDACESQENTDHFGHSCFNGRDLNSEDADSSYDNIPEHSTPLAKHIAKLTKYHKPGIGKKWPPPGSVAKEVHDDGFAEGHVWSEPVEDSKSCLQVEKEPWHVTLNRGSYANSPRVQEQADWGPLDTSVSEAGGSGLASKEHSPWPICENMYQPSHDWQSPDSGTPSFSTTSSHSMRRVDLDWQTLQLNSSDNVGFGEPLFVNVNDSLDNSADTLYFLPSLTNSPKVEEFLAEASSMLDQMDPERFHQLLMEIENNSDTEDVGEFSATLQKLAENEGNFAVLAELDKLFQTYMCGYQMTGMDDEGLLSDTVENFGNCHEAEPCMSPGGEEYSESEDLENPKPVAQGHGQTDPMYNLWEDNEQFSGPNWYLGPEESNIVKGHSCSDIAYWSDSETPVEQKPDAPLMHTSSSHGQLSSLVGKKSKHGRRVTIGHSFSMPLDSICDAGSLTGSTSLLPSECSAFKDKIPRRLSHVQSEPHLPSQSRKLELCYKSDSDLFNKTAPVITLQSETKPSIGEGFHKNEATETGEAVIFSPKTHFRPIRNLTQGSEKGNGDAAQGATGKVEAATGTVIQHPEKRAIFDFSPEKDEDYQLFVTSDSDSEGTFVPKFKVNLCGEKWSQTDSQKRKRKEGIPKECFTDDCMETCREKLEQCSQEILLHCKRNLKTHLADTVIEEEEEGLKSKGDQRSPDDIFICDHNGNIGDSEQTSAYTDIYRFDKTNAVNSCHDKDCFCPECGIDRQVALAEPHWNNVDTVYSIGGQGKDKKIVENRDGESLQGSSECLGFNKLSTEREDVDSGLQIRDSDSVNVENNATTMENGNSSRRKEDDFDVMALCSTVNLMQIDSVSPTARAETEVQDSVISTAAESTDDSPIPAVNQNVSEIWAAGGDLINVDDNVNKEPMKYSIWSVGGEERLPSLPVTSSVDKFANPLCLTPSGANNNSLVDGVCTEDVMLKEDETKDNQYIFMDKYSLGLDSTLYDSDDLGLPFLHHPPRPRAFYSSELEEVWMRSSDFTESWYSRRKRRSRSRSGSISNKPCSFYMEGNCRRADCRFSHDLSSITCRFWEKGECFKGVTCPFMHGYPNSQTSVESDTFPLEAEDFPPLSQESKSDSDEKRSTP